MSPPVAQLLFSLIYLLGGAFGIMSALYGKSPGQRVLGAIGTLTLISCIFIQFGRAEDETCQIVGSDVRFYGNPEMCSSEVIDRLTVDSEVNGNPAGADIIDPPTTEDGFDGDTPTT
jgi:hypothetical protein